MKRMLLIAIASVACSKTERTPAQKLEDAQVTTKRYAFEAFPSWAMSHPDKSCPGKLGEMNEYMNRDNIDDPWGRPYVMLCGDRLPSGAKGIAIQSLGPDGQDGTADDVKSW